MRDRRPESQRFPLIVSCTSSRSFVRRLSPALCFVIFASLNHPCFGQTAPSREHALLISPSLPDSPGATLSQPALGGPKAPSDSSSSLTVDEPSVPHPGDVGGAAAGGQNIGHHSTVAASPSDKYIEPGQQAPHLTAGDKVRLGLRDAVSPFAAIGWITSAAYSQAIDSSPNYGQGWGPFGQRLGASAARASSEGIFSDSVFAPIFHEDPRYYRIGPGRNVVHRALYAVTRVVVSRSDDGRATPNFSLIAGNAAGSILTNAYYPQSNRTVRNTAETFAGSIGGSALGFVVSEFLSDALGIVHLQKTE